MPRLLDVTTSFLASALRMPLGHDAGALGKRPKQPLELYEYEGCPYCRKVREALSMLDLEAMVYPCPQGGKRFRARVEQKGGKAQFPYLVDPNTKTAMYESNDIVSYLYRTYGAGTPPLMLKLGPLTTLTSALASATRFGQGVKYTPSHAPKQPLELWSFEVSPFCRLVRETLSSLEIPYLLHNVAKNSPSRAAFVGRSGKMMVPYLVDPNTNVAMFESSDIIAYLHKTYAAG